MSDRTLLLEVRAPGVWLSTHLGVGRPHDRAVLMLLGGGAKRAAIRWCQQQQDDHLSVLTTWDAWTRWLNRDEIWSNMHR